MELKINGTIKLINQLQTWDSGFSKREFVITTKEQYPQDIKFEVVKEKAEKFEEFNKVGDEVDVKFNVRGNEYNGNYYVNLQAWYISKVGSGENAQTTQPVASVNDLPMLDESEEAPF